MPRSSRVYIGNLSSRAHERDLDDLFYKCGKIRSVEIKRGGFGFVEFFDDSDASYAVRQYDNVDLLGRRIRVEHCIGRANDRDKNRPRRDKAIVVEVTGLDAATTWKTLKDWARDSVNVSFTKIEGSVGLMEFGTAEDAKAAVRALDGSKLDGAVVRVREKTRENAREGSRERSASPRRDRSRSPGRDRERSASPRRDRDRRDSRDRSRSPRRRSPSPRRSRSDRSPSPRRERSPSPRRNNDAPASPVKHDADVDPAFQEADQE